VLALENALYRPDPTVSSPTFNSGSVSSSSFPRTAPLAAAPPLPPASAPAEEPARLVPDDPLARLAAEYLLVVQISRY
jgi:hypothetical protein